MEEGRGKWFGKEKSVHTVDFLLAHNLLLRVPEMPKDIDKKKVLELAQKRQNLDKNLERKETSGKTGKQDMLIEDASRHSEGSKKKKGGPSVKKIIGETTKKTRKETTGWSKDEDVEDRGDDIFLEEVPGPHKDLMVEQIVESVRKTSDEIFLGLE